MTHSILGAVAFAGLMGAQFLAAIVLKSKPAAPEPDSPTPLRSTESPTTQAGQLLQPASPL